MGKSSINGSFSMAMLNNQMVTGLSLNHVTVGRPGHLHVRPAAVHGNGGAQPLDARNSLPGWWFGNDFYFSLHWE